MSSTPKLRGRVWLLHGFNVRDGGTGSVDKLMPAIEGADFEPVEYDYGWLFLAGAKFLDKRLAKMLAKLVRPGDCVIAHSNGCCIAQMAAELGAPFAIMSFISPALDRDTPVPPQVLARHVWYTPSDEWVGKARWLPGVRWGDMGRVGYQRTGYIDSRNHNINGEIVLNHQPIRHSGWFGDDLIKRTAENVVGQLLFAHLRLTDHIAPELIPAPYDQ